MRPIRKQRSPVATFSKYKDAQSYLVERISKGTTSDGYNTANYCSYCERAICTSLAVEHIEPKDGLYGQPQLETTWSNFLLSCVNCNSTKGSKQVNFSNLFFPDRDNTFYAFKYMADGTIIPNPSLPPESQLIAKKTLDLFGLRKKKSQGKKQMLPLKELGSVCRHGVKQRLLKPNI